MARSNRRRTRPARGGRKGPKRGGSNKLVKIVALVALPVMVLGGGGYGFIQRTQIEQISAEYCYPRPNQAQTAIFLDYSVNPNLSAAQRRDLVNALERAYSETPVNGRIMIFTTARDSTGSIAKPVFVICRPASTSFEQAAIGAPETTGPRLAHIAGEANAHFHEAVQRILAETQDADKTAKESPILSSVRAISRYSGFQGRDRRFVWLSDGLENSETAAFGMKRGEMPGFASFAKRADYDLIRPDALTGMDVTVLLVESLTLPQPGLEFVTHDELRRWWPAFFEANGAARVRLERLRPVNGS